MKTNILIVLFALSLGACNNSGNDAKKEAENINDTKIDSSKMNYANENLSKNDADFLVFAADVGSFEIQAGQLAAKNSHDKKVKDFADMMVKDHSAMADQVHTLATQKNVTLPTDLSNPLKDEWTKLDSLKGDKFDKEYADFNVKGHEQAISKFQQVADSSSNYSPDVKQLAMGALPKLKEHKEHSDMLRSEVTAEKK
jgi:putative membrane protein